MTGEGGSAALREHGCSLKGLKNGNRYHFRCAPQRGRLRRVQHAVGRGAPGRAP
ncbi:hypothetical protein ACFQX7_26480 [Luedemannella flava]